MNGNPVISWRPSGCFSDLNDMEDILIVDSPLIKNINALIPGHLKTLSDLNEWESSNILEAQRLFFSTPKKRVFTSELIQKLHKKMFDRTWAWAGIYRSRDLFEGLNRHLISKSIYELCIDLAHWQNKHMNIIEQSVRLHHVLASIRRSEEHTSELQSRQYLV